MPSIWKKFSSAKGPILIDKNGVTSQIALTVKNLSGKLGPIALVYAGSGSFVERDDAARHAVIEAKGKDVKRQLDKLQADKEDAQDERDAVVAGNVKINAGTN